MAIENRGKNQYYYKKIRVGNRVKSQYMGPISTPWIAAAARLDHLDTERRLEGKQLQKAELAHPLEIDKTLSQLATVNRMLVKLELLNAGYYSHKRQWRKSREAR